ncbi:MAG: M1 family metallopeptidase [Clostridia bacterium]|nr:M1 family metallopeptidase [Clostridia bacterium]
MKKLYFILALLFVPMMFFGCSSKDVMQKVSENCDYYKITASLNTQEKTLVATEEFYWTNKTGDTLSSVLFHLHPNAFKEGAKTNYAVSQTQENRAYNGEKDFGGITINSVYCNENSLNFNILGEDEHLLEVELNEAILPKKSTVLKIEFSLDIPKVNHRFGYGANTINLGNFYPILSVYENGEWNRQGYLSSGDPFYSKVANYEVSLSYSDDYLLKSTGNLVTENTQNGQKTSVYSALAVRDFAMVLSKDFKEISQQVDETLVTYSYYEDENPEAHLKTAVDSLNTFNELFGVYPYKTLCVVKTNFLHGGMEYPNLVYVSDQITNESEYNNVIVHEIAHQWWYGLVGNNELKYGFIDEGLAEYSTALFYEMNDGYKTTKEEVIGNALSSYMLFCDVFKEVYGELNSQMNRDIQTFNTETEYIYLTYVKGLLMFDSIENTIGQNKMLKCLKGIVSDYAFCEITPKEMIECFEKYSKRNLQSFITSWLDGSVILEEIKE